MIKAVISDVDGVMVGSREGVNFPVPHQDVLGALGQVAHAGTGIVLCTAKFRPAIDKIVFSAHLDGPHITDGGAFISNPLAKPEVIEMSQIEPELVLAYLDGNTAYTELFNGKDCFVEEYADPEFMEKRRKLLQKDPVVVDDIAEIAAAKPIIKINTFTEEDSDMPAIEARVQRFQGKVSAIWSEHPFLLPRRSKVITAAGTSKGSAAIRVAEYLGISPSEMLGVGDMPADWDFMQHCGFVASVGGNQELRGLVETGGESYLAGSVDEHALLDILDHFELR